LAAESSGSRQRGRQKVLTGTKFEPLISLLRLIPSGENSSASNAIMKAILFRFAAVLISLVIVALLGEVALRLFAPRLGVAVNEKNRFCRFDHDLGWAPLENITWVEKDIRYVIHQNQFGLRAPDDMHLKKTSGS
jgi:hypothetical protein